MFHMTSSNWNISAMIRQTSKTCSFTQQVLLKYLPCANYSFGFGDTIMKTHPFLPRRLGIY